MGGAAGPAGIGTGGRGARLSQDGQRHRVSVGAWWSWVMMLPQRSPGSASVTWSSKWTDDASTLCVTRSLGLCVLWGFPIPGLLETIPRALEAGRGLTEAARGLPCAGGRVWV